MRSSILLGVTLVGGCFAHSDRDLPCGQGQRCPTGQTCGVVDGQQVCVLGGADAPWPAGDGPALDARADASTGGPDAAPPDASLATCPTSYESLGSGLPSIRRSLIATTFDGAIADCGDDAPGRTFLIAFRSQAELDAYRLTNTQDAWVGVRYDVVVNMFFSLDGLALTFLPWEAGETGTEPGRCPLVRPSSGLYITRSCNLSRPYACECRP